MKNEKTQLSVKKAKAKPPAVLVKVATGSSYADTVKALRGPGGIDLAKVGVNAESLKLRRTREGHLLVELAKSKGSEAAAGKLSAAISSELGNQVGAVTQLGRSVEVEVVDIDAAADKAEVLEAFLASIPGDDEDPVVKCERESVTITGLWSVKSGQQVATLRVSRSVANVVTKVKIGWTVCRVKIRMPAPTRCFRCHGFGHSLIDCKGPDLSIACRRCGEAGHKEKDCTGGDDLCVACDRAGAPKVAHRPGSGACMARRTAKSAMVRPFNSRDD